MPSRVPPYHPRRLPGPSRHREYDQHARDRASALFYASTAWRKLRAHKLRTDPLCSACEACGLLVPATHVHHKQERRDSPALAFELDNLESLCASCHSRLHAADRSEPLGGGSP